MEAEDINLDQQNIPVTVFQRIMERTKERELLIDKENAWLESDIGESIVRTSLEMDLSNQLSNKNEQSSHSLYPTEELETLRRISTENLENLHLHFVMFQRNFGSPLNGGTTDNNSNAKLRARFAALAASVENFEYEMRHTRPSPPGLSSEDMSPTKLFTPVASYHSLSSSSKPSKSSLSQVKDEKQICIHEEDSISYVDESFEKSSGEQVTTMACRNNNSLEKPTLGNLSRKISEKRLRFANPEYELTMIHSSPDDCSTSCEKLDKDEIVLVQLDEKNYDNQKDTSESETLNRLENEKYGIHRFFKRKSSRLTKESENDNTKSNEQSWTKLKPGKDESTCDDKMVTENRATRVFLRDKKTRTREMARQLDEKFRSEKIEARIAPKISLSISKFQQNSSQLQKSRAEIDIRSANVKSLRKRWEVSSVSGTPLHPDQEEDELLEAAIKMAKITKDKRLRPQSYCETKRKFFFSLKNSTIGDFVLESSHYSDLRPISAAYSTSCIQSTENENQQYSFEVNKLQDVEILEELHKVNISDKSSNEPSQLIDDTPDKNSSLMSAILNTPEVQQNESFKALRNSESAEAASLAHSVSFYRKKEKENRTMAEAVMLGQFTPPPFTSSSSFNHSTSKASMNERISFEVERARLEKAISVQQEQIVQASRALSFCHSTQEFKGSREEVDAQRALLIATERRRALIIVLDHLIHKHATGSIQYCIPDGPKGNLTFSDISVKLMRDFVNGHLLFYFIVLIRYEETVHHTTLTTSDEGICSGRLEFPHYIQFRSLPHDFNCKLEIYALRTRRELLRRETKYHIKGGSSLKKSHKSIYPSGMNSLAGPSAVIDPSFQRIGHLSLNIASVNKTRFQLCDPLYPLDGHVDMKVRCYAEDCGTVGHKGFLSLYQPVQNIASWTRLWCVLWDGQLRFWRYPEDESTKIPVVSIDLRTCACKEIKPIPVERCPYPNSMQIDVWLSGKDPQKPDRIRILMAADRKDDMLSWLNAMNISLRNLTIWSGRS
ncbi:unnamed protein product [Thelazia callipaeda]|uniref:PH domain-containing protein n=1 Tax=Thelazia callipaeda TaxID=103827 RepID=A0A158RAV2_THECL|nr:unnamed protein product [Thelazia callipaeda]